MPNPTPGRYPARLCFKCTTTLLERIEAAAVANFMPVGAYARDLIEANVPQLPAPKIKRKKRSKK